MLRISKFIMIYDTHAHLDIVKDLDKVILNAKSANVKLIISNSVNIKTLKQSFEFQKKYPEIVKVAAGLYPQDALTREEGILQNDSFEDFKKIVKENKNLIVAIGEIGLDLKNGENLEEQTKLFKEQLNLAKELNLPVIIHSRKAEKEALEILQEYNDLTIIMHCFSGKKPLVKQAIELGCYFSIPTNVVKSEQFQGMLQIIPKEKILTETDAPFLSPFKDKQNEPAFIEESIKAISKIWNLSIKETEKIIEENFERVF